jgi:glycosyltransferase involved in cell wall biosynthesis
MWRGKTVSIVFPAYNEADYVGHAVADFLATGVVDEVVVVDNNSRDETAERAAASGARVVREERQGYGYALRRGLAEANGDVVVLSEPDGTFAGHDVVKLLAYSEDFDLVCGTRTTRELLWHEANMGFFLRVGNVSVAKLLQLLFGGPSLSDCGCTMRLINREGVRRISGSLTVGGSHFLPEMVILALVNGLRVIEIPLNYRGRVGVSKITGRLRGVVGTGARMVWLILRYRLKLGRTRAATKLRTRDTERLN